MLLLYNVVMGCYYSIRTILGEGCFVMELKFYRCSHCGNIIVKLKDSGAPVSCCGDVMVQLQPGTSDGAHEKHVPVVAQNKHN